jgi:hypothetical protein
LATNWPLNSLLVLLLLEVLPAAVVASRDFFKEMVEFLFAFDGLIDIGNIL